MYFPDGDVVRSYYFKISKKKKKTKHVFFMRKVFFREGKILRRKNILEIRRQRGCRYNVTLKQSDSYSYSIIEDERWVVTVPTLGVPSPSPSHHPPLRLARVDQPNGGPGPGGKNASSSGEFRKLQHSLPHNLRKWICHNKRAYFHGKVYLPTTDVVFA